MSRVFYDEDATDAVPGDYYVDMAGSRIFGEDMVEREMTAEEKLELRIRIREDRAWNDALWEAHKVVDASPVGTRRRIMELIR